MKKSFVLRIVVYFSGLILMSYGLSLGIRMHHLGVAAWDVLNLGLVKTFGMTVGMWGLIVGILITVVVFVMNRSYLSYGTCINIIFIGPMIDVFLHHPFIEVGNSLWTQWSVFLIGAFLCGIGSGMYVSAKFGSGPRDALMQLVREKTGWDIVKARLVIEMSVFIIGVCLGGPLFFGTIVFTLIMSKMFKVSNQLWTDVLWNSKMKAF